MILDERHCYLGFAKLNIIQRVKPSVSEEGKGIFYIHDTGACNETEHKFFSLLLSSIFAILSSFFLVFGNNTISFPPSMLTEVSWSPPSLPSTLLEHYCILAECKTSR